MAKASMMNALGEFALSLPGTEEGVACAGTALESRTFRVGTKSFLFLRAPEMRLKLAASVKEAGAWAAKDPAHVSVGANGWICVKFDGLSIPPRQFEKWIEESHGLVGAPAPRKTPARTTKMAKTKRDS